MPVHSPDKTSYLYLRVLCVSAVVFLPGINPTFTFPQTKLANRIGVALKSPDSRFGSYGFVLRFPRRASRSRQKTVMTRR